MEPWLDELLAAGRSGPGRKNREVQAGHVLALHVVVRCKLRPERLATAFDSIAAEFKAANAGETQREGRKGSSLK